MERVAAEEEAGELLWCCFAGELFAVDSTSSPDAGLFGSVGEVADCTVDTGCAFHRVGEVVDDCGNGSASTLADVSEMYRFARYTPPSAHYRPTRIPSSKAMNGCQRHPSFRQRLLLENRRGDDGQEGITR